MLKLRNYVPEFLNCKNSFLMLLLRKKRLQTYRMVKPEMYISSVIWGLLEKMSLKSE